MSAKNGGFNLMSALGENIHEVKVGIKTVKDDR